MDQIIFSALLKWEQMCSQTLVQTCWETGREEQTPGFPEYSMLLLALLLKLLRLFTCQTQFQTTNLFLNVLTWMRKKNLFSGPHQSVPILTPFLPCACSASLPSHSFTDVFCTVGSSIPVLKVFFTSTSVGAAFGKIGQPFIKKKKAWPSYSL